LIRKKSTIFLSLRGDVRKVWDGIPMPLYFHPTTHMHTSSSRLPGRAESIHLSATEKIEVRQTLIDFMRANPRASEYADAVVLSNETLAGARR
jgi:hypothetical protein